jgi:long-chain acyl-CoA synthetase
VTHAAVEACCVTGANLGQPVALVMLNAEAIQRAMDSAARAALEESLALHMQGVNALLDPHEQLDCLVVVSEAWTVDNDLVTPTLKVKRNRIETVYAQHYERWVAERKAVVWQR